MNHLILPILGLILCISNTWSQGNIEADKVQADTLIGDGSRITGITNQNLAVSQSGDTLRITEGNYVIIPGLSASNSGNAFANAGADFVNACETSFNLQAGQLQQGTTGEWSIVSGTGGSLINKTLPQALFIGQEGESYLLQWTVQHGGGNSSFDQLNISIATNTETSVANAGVDLFAIMTQSVALNGNPPEIDSEGKWEILEGSGGILDDPSDPVTLFTGVGGETYRLRWKHFNSCSRSTDEVILTFSESASGSPSSNGRYYIPDSKFRQYLQIAFPSTMDGDSLIVASGALVDKIKITNLGVLNLDGIQYLTAFTLFEALNNNDLRSIPYLSESLKVLKCHARLSIIADFPANLDTIVAGSWSVSSLPTLPPNLKYLELSDFSDIISLPTFPPTLKYLRMSLLSRIASIPMIPEGCEYVELNYLSGANYYDQSTSEDVQVLLTGTINIPASAKSFYAYYIRGLDNFPTLPTIKTNLQKLTIQETDISETPSLYSFTSLKELYLQNNALLKLDSIPFALQNLNVQGNPLICVENKPPLVADQLTSYPICP